jgi:ubiquinone/menaquinone biosynthesis C-methylase UbiE
MAKAKPLSNISRPAALSAAGRLSRFATERNAARQRNVWSRRISSWDQHGSAGLSKVTAAMLDMAAVEPGQVVVDLGSGNGQISLPLARREAEVLAVDVSPAMVHQLRRQARAGDVSSLDAIAVPIEHLDLPQECADLVVSSYALHHLRDADKAVLVREAFRWLRPGGRLIVADMMFGRGGSRRDREIIRMKLTALARKGPGGWWRIAKGAARYLLRVQERPISMAAWVSLLEGAGFTGITASAIVAEAGIVTGQRPGAAGKHEHAIESAAQRSAAQRKA